MKRAWKLAVAAALVTAGCSLIVDTDAVRRGRDGGSAGGGEGGGATGGGSAGGTAGGTAGGGGTGGGGGGSGGGSMPFYDGGAPCPQSPRPRLMCDPPVTLASSGSPKYAALAAVGDSLLAAWMAGNRVELHRYDLDGGNQLVLGEDTAAAPQRLMLASEGKAWAMIYHTGDGTPVRCFSSFDDGGVTSGNTGYNGAAVAVAADGGVAVAVSASNLTAGVGTPGCPTSLAAQMEPFITDYVGVVHVPGRGVDGFRYTVSGFLDFGVGDVAVMGPLSDGGFDFSGLRVSEGLGDNSATLSSSGQDVLITYSDDQTASLSNLRLRALPVDLSPLIDSSVIIATGARWFNNSGCGPGCLASSWAPVMSPSHVTVRFTTDDANFLDLGPSDAEWDVACSTRLGATEVMSAYAAGKLWFLITDSMTARLYPCTLPF